MTEIQKALDLFNKSELIPVKDRWNLPFPMGVFGTLRNNQCNNRRMHRGKVSLHRKAFLPHFIAHGLSISYYQDASAPFEVFFYEEKEWNKMIVGVDSLEGFHPDDCFLDGEWHWYGYFRTLAWLHLLPEDFEHDLFKKVRLSENRDLGLKPETWKEFDKVPCWVYSSRRENDCAKNKGVVIWG